MLDISLTTRDLVALANTLAAAPFSADVAQERAADRAMADTLDLMRERSDSAANPTALVHVVTGALRDSFTASARRVRRGEAEGLIRPGVPYADEEIARGGSHDYAARTTQAAAPIRERAARRLAGEVAEIIEGRL